MAASSDALRDLQPFLDTVESLVAAHALGPPGAYARWTRPNASGPRDLDLNPYGCADAVNLLYSLGKLPSAPEERSAWIDTLQGLQDPRDGFFREATHHPIHTTAHCVAALELLDAVPRHPLRALAPLREPEAMEAFLDALDWPGNPWLESHRGAGLYAALLLVGDLDASWEDRYFTWLAGEVDPPTGLLRRGCVSPKPEDEPLLFPHLAGTFHYLFNFEHARRELPHPQALVDTCLGIFEKELFPFSRFVGFAEIDWVYCLTRSLRRCDHRAAEAHRALAAFAERHVDFLASLDPATDEGLDDLHALFGTLCALAELQAALRDRLRSDRPLRLVLDRRPFI
jgi:hypothetical protein